MNLNLNLNEDYALLSLVSQAHQQLFSIPTAPSTLSSIIVGSPPDSSTLPPPLLLSTPSNSIFDHTSPYYPTLSTLSVPETISQYPSLGCGTLGSHHSRYSSIPPPPIITTTAQHHHQQQQQQQYLSLSGLPPPVNVLDTPTGPSPHLITSPITAISPPYEDRFLPSGLQPATRTSSLSLSMTTPPTTTTTTIPTITPSNLHHLTPSLTTTTTTTQSTPTLVSTDLNNLAKPVMISPLQQSTLSHSLHHPTPLNPLQPNPHLADGHYTSFLHTCHLQNQIRQQMATSAPVGVSKIPPNPIAPLLSSSLPNVKIYPSFTTHIPSIPITQSFQLPPLPLQNNQILPTGCSGPYHYQSNPYTNSSRSNCTLPLAQLPNGGVYAMLGQRGTPVEYASDGLPVVKKIQKIKFSLATVALEDVSHYAAYMGTLLSRLSHKIDMNYLHYLAVKREYERQTNDVIPTPYYYPKFNQSLDPATGRINHARISDFLYLNASGQIDLSLMPPVVNDFSDVHLTTENWQETTPIALPSLPAELSSRSITKDDVLSAYKSITLSSSLDMAEQTFIVQLIKTQLGSLLFQQTIAMLHADAQGLPRPGHSQSSMVTNGWCMLGYWHPCPGLHTHRAFPGEHLIPAVSMTTFVDFLNATNPPGLTAGCTHKDKVNLTLAQVQDNNHIVSNRLHDALCLQFFTTQRFMGVEHAKFLLETLVNYLFTHIQHSFIDICTDVCGNYILQNLIPFWTQEQYYHIATLIAPRIHELSCHNQSTRVIQALLYHVQYTSTMGVYLDGLLKMNGVLSYYIEKVTQYYIQLRTARRPAFENICYDEDGYEVIKLNQASYHQSALVEREQHNHDHSPSTTESASSHIDSSTLSHHQYPKNPSPTATGEPLTIVPDLNSSSSVQSLKYSPNTPLRAISLTEMCTGACEFNPSIPSSIIYADHSIDINNDLFLSTDIWTPVIDPPPFESNLNKQQQQQQQQQPYNQHTLTQHYNNQQHHGQPWSTNAANIPQKVKRCFCQHIFPPEWRLRFAPIGEIIPRPGLSPSPSALTIVGETNIHQLTTTMSHSSGSSVGSVQSTHSHGLGVARAENITFVPLYPTPALTAPISATMDKTLPFGSPALSNTPSHTSTYTTTYSSGSGCIGTSGRLDLMANPITTSAIMINDPLNTSSCGDVSVPESCFCQHFHHQMFSRWGELIRSDLSWHAIVPIMLRVPLWILTLCGFVSLFSSQPSLLCTTANGVNVSKRFLTTLHPKHLYHYFRHSVLPFTHNLAFDSLGNFVIQQLIDRTLSRFDCDVFIDRRLQYNVSNAIVEEFNLKVQSQHLHTCSQVLSELTDPEHETPLRHPENSKMQAVLCALLGSPDPTKPNDYIDDIFATPVSFNGQGGQGEHFSTPDNGGEIIDGIHVAPSPSIAPLSSRSTRQPLPNGILRAPLPFNPRHSWSHPIPTIDQTNEVSMMYFRKNFSATALPVTNPQQQCCGCIKFSAYKAIATDLVATFGGQLIAMCYSKAISCIYHHFFVSRSTLYTSVTVPLWQYICRNGIPARVTHEPCGRSVINRLCDIVPAPSNQKELIKATLSQAAVANHHSSASRGGGSGGGAGHGNNSSNNIYNNNNLTNFSSGHHSYDNSLGNGINCDHTMSHNFNTSHNQHRSNLSSLQQHLPRQPRQPHQPHQPHQQPRHSQYIYQDQNGPCNGQRSNNDNNFGHHNNHHKRIHRHHGYAPQHNNTTTTNNITSHLDYPDHRNSSASSDIYNPKEPRIISHNHSTTTSNNTSNNTRSDLSSIDNFSQGHFVPYQPLQFNALDSTGHKIPSLPQNYQPFHPNPHYQHAKNK